MKPLSFTQISLYQSCPLCYKLQYVDGLKPGDRWYFSFGSSLHACAEFFFKVNVPPPPALPDLLDYYETRWLSAGYESPEEEARYKAYGRDILARFWEIHCPGFRLPVATERLFNVLVDGVRVIGFIDRVDRLDDGLAITDYKSSRDLFTSDDLAGNLQLTLYQLAAEQMWQLPVRRLTLYHLRSNTACSCPPRDKTALDGARHVVLEVADKIASQQFPATENQFCPCDFSEHCPYYRHLSIAQSPPRQERLPGFVAVEAVESYVALQGQIKELQSRLDEVKNAIIEFCQSQGLKRLYGSDHAITCEATERTVYDEDAVKALLDPEGLWEQVASLDPARLKELLAGSSLTPGLKRQLECLRQVSSRYYQLRARKIESEE